MKRMTVKRTLAVVFVTGALLGSGAGMAVAHTDLAKGQCENGKAHGADHSGDAPVPTDCSQIPQD